MSFYFLLLVVSLCDDLYKPNLFAWISQDKLFSEAAHGAESFWVRACFNRIEHAEIG